MCERGILICGTGAGMAIAANKVPGIYAAVCHGIYTAQKAMHVIDACYESAGTGKKILIENYVI